ncbi:DUF4136 domain-containing protein [Imperialibacter roseus]|uniref:DUF4136 domain-containing protein n=1 Tax=Imperialibacter roseus TaxID=1324217 RepID=A0ABZ0ITF9_9BACT|nr:DUF4136 domain-containing protein [Imperialibacter roseus]WOK07255.1 DUF4136 domain-containing protein [Imperialibacter roseus]
MTIKNIFIFIGIITAVVSCNVYRDVQIFKDKKADFGQYQTYAWLPEAEHPADSACTDDLIRRNIRNYFTHCLTQRKLRSDTINAQLLLRIEWLSHAREVNLPPVYDLPEFFDIGYYYAPTLYLRGGKLTGKPGWRNPYMSPEKVEYIHGGVKLTAIDRQTNQLVWEGVAQGDLYDLKVMLEDLHPAVHKMMKQFSIKITTN